MLQFAPLCSAHSLARFAPLRSLVGASDAMVQRSLKKNEECAGKMKKATENEEFDTMVRILKRNDLCTMVSDLPTRERTSGLFKNDAVFCKINHSELAEKRQSSFEARIHRVDGDSLALALMTTKL